MTTTHEAFQWVAGDDCQINATLLDENGNPFDLSGPPEIKWALMNAAFQRVLDEDDVSISIIDAAAGRCSIMIPAAKTTLLMAGRYTDALRIVFGGITSTLSTGQVYVGADPWAAPEAATASKPAAAPARLRLAASG